MYLVDSNGFYLKPYNHVKGNPVPPNVVTQEPMVPRDGLTPRYIRGQWELVDQEAYLDSIAPDESEVSPINQNVPTLYIKNREVTFKDTQETVSGLGDVYYIPTDRFIRVVHDITDGEDNILTEIDAVTLGYPPVLQLPVSKIVVNGDQTTNVDEVYFVTQIIKGKIICTGKIPVSGNWKIRSERVNQAISAIAAQWAVDFKTITFYVNDEIPRD